MPDSAFNKQPLCFQSEDVTLQGWWAKPLGAGPHPLIILTHGLSAVIALDIDNYATHFLNAGFACLAYDHRNWGESGGWPRAESDPWRQVADLREAISLARNLPGVDAERIGLWGTSYAGGHVLTATALDRRVRCVVSQVPLVSGSRTFDAWIPADKREGFLAKLEDDRDARAQGMPPAITKSALPGSETAEWIASNDHHGKYDNALTLRSFDLLRTYEPISFVANIAPTPAMLIIADHDTQTPTAWQLEAFELMGEPKKLVQLNCRHYDPYMTKLEQAATAALGWYRAHL
ncbi:MAG: alpha/beta fold hydrolase [Pseudomonadota bacterium]